MKRFILLFVSSLLFCLEAYCGSNYSTSKTMYVGESVTLYPRSDCNASYCWNTSITYNTEAFHVEKISQTNSLGSQNVNGSTTGTYYNFKLTALKAGIYTVTCVVQYYQSSSGYANQSNTATYTITVKNVPQVVSISNIPSTLTLSLGDIYTFSPIIYETGASTTLTWTSSNTSVATIDGKNLTTKGVGTTTITCTAHNGVSAQCVVTVNPVFVSDITLNETETELTVGEKLQLEATIAPDNATDKSVTWSSTNEAVAVVSENGLVTAVGSGTCQVKATANDGSGKSAPCLVTVEKNNKLTVTDMTLSNGGRGTMRVLLTDEETVRGFQFDLYLPDGVTVPTDTNGKLMANLTGNANFTHQLSATQREGFYRFSVLDFQNRELNSENGDGLAITIDVDGSVAKGDYDVSIKNITMTVDRDGQPTSVNPKDNTATLKVIDAIPGDVDGNGKVDITDVYCVVYYLLEKAPAKFIFKAADLNNNGEGDGKITITDAQLVLEIIMNN